MFEIWVSDRNFIGSHRSRGGMRFNACFADRERAHREYGWYQDRGYLVEIREGKS